MEEETDSSIVKGVQIREKNASIKYIDFNLEDDETLSRGHRHSSEEFERSLLDDEWTSKYYYIICSIVIGTGHDVFPITMKLATQLSGGSFLLLLLIFSLFMGLPLIYMETFMGRYTKLTNCQMYRMVPIFFGVCVGIFVMNVCIQPMHAASTAQLLVNLLNLLANPDINTKCLDENHECYDYEKKGKLNDTCRYGHISMICKNRGEIRYLMEYRYWKTFKDPLSTIFPYLQIITGVVITWIVILVIIMKKLQALGGIMNVAFIIQTTILTIIFFLALLRNGGINGLNALVNVNFEKFDMYQILMVQSYSLCRLGIIIPTGFMTFSAYGKFGNDIGSECFMIVVSSVFMVGYYLAIFFTVCGVLADEMGVAVEAVIIPDKGLFLALIPQFLVQMRMPNLFLVIYYGAIWYSETVRIAFYVHMLVLNLYDYFPTLKNFPTYIWVTSCLLLCLLSIPASGQFYNTVYVPVLWAMFVTTGIVICISLQVTMISYFYGVARLSNDIHFMTGQKPMRLLRCMWYILPFIGWCNVVFMVKHRKKSFLENSNDTQENVDNEWLYGSLTSWGTISLCIFCTIMYIAFRFGHPGLLIALLKPQYFWGPSAREIRTERKNFYPETSIRSQQFRSRMKTEHEHFATIQEGVLISEFSRDVLSEQAGRGDVLRDKVFFEQIGLFSHLRTSTSGTSFLDKKEREFDGKHDT